MKKVFCFMVLLLIIPSKLYASNLELNSSKVIIYDPDTDYVLYEKDSDKISSVASLTKIMTTIVAIENIKDIKENIVITNDMLKNIPYDASRAGLKINDVVTYEDLLYASILPSGADATTALAINISGSVDSFVGKMNSKAKELKMYDTNFSNVTGYETENHYSTCNDLLKMLNYSLKNELFKKIYKTKSYVLTNGLFVNSTINKYNENLKLDLSNIIGSKTGYTPEAGLCMSAIINLDGKELILITLGAKRINNIPHNLMDTLSIINYYSSNYENKTIYKSENILFSIPVDNSKIDKYDIKLKNSIIKYLDKNDKISYKYNGLLKLDSTNKVNEKIASIKYYSENKLIHEEDIILDKKIEFSPIKYLLSNIYIVIIPLVVIFCIILVMIISLYNKNNKLLFRSKQ